MSTAPILLWFRQDLRIADNRALSAACETGRPVLPVYVLDDETPGRWRIGSASRWWLHNSLKALTKRLATLGAPLILRHGAAVSVLEQLVEETSAAAIYCTRAYEPWARQSESALATLADENDFEFRRFAGSLLFEPETVQTKSGTPFRVFTPFWKVCQAATPPKQPVPAPEKIHTPTHFPVTERLEDWNLIPSKPDWSLGFGTIWQPGEESAREQAMRFLDNTMKTYSATRDRPDTEGTSRLSPHLRFGEISPHQCWQATQAKMAAAPETLGGGWSFLRELAWREFSYHLLFHWPTLPEAPFQPKFANMRWVKDPEGLRAWQKGRTGIPIIDAGMRELWQTGWMHNRVRMIVASLLIKNMQVDWREGEAWFWDTLVDADLANNAASWQWVAGSGADAAPYFRIFNPVLQGKKFDPDGHYVRRYVPELKSLPNRHIHEPWQAGTDVLSEASVILGDTYPYPVVDLRESRQRALAAYSAMKGSIET